MAYSIRAMQKNSGRMVKAALPMGNALPRGERIAEFEKALLRLSEMEEEVTIEMCEGKEPNPEVFVPLGIHATRAALSSLVYTGTVDHRAAMNVAGELQSLCAFIDDHSSFSSERGRQTKGFSAELAVPNMIWTGIADGELGLSYAILMGIHGQASKRAGKSRDVDMVVKPGWYNEKARQRVQLKSSKNWGMQDAHDNDAADSTEQDAPDIYEKGIIVISAQELLDTGSAGEAIGRLLRWNREDPFDQVEVYNLFEEKLGLTRPEPGAPIPKPFIMPAPNIERSAA